MTISEKFINITDVTLAQADIAADWKSDAGASPSFRVNIAGGAFQLQMQSHDGLKPFFGTMFVEMWLGSSNNQGFTWLIS